MKKVMRKIKLFAAMLATVLSFGAGADVVPFGIFNSNMVLPRDRPVAVWGKADAGEAVSVAFAGQKVSTTADAKGAWSVRLAAMEANKTGRTMTVTGKNTLTFDNVLVGDVWLCSGQSNMHLQFVAGSKTIDGQVSGRNEIVAPYVAEADDYPMIRSLTGAWGQGGTQRITEFNGDESPWLVAASNAMERMTLAGYFFARRIVQETGVPIGLVDTSVNGMGIASFMSPQYDAFNRSLAGFGIKGVLWYQGESDVVDGEAYRFRLKQMVAEWREALAQPSLPFYYVQLSTYAGSNYAAVREGQRMALTMIPEPVGMAVAIDIGWFGSLHPDNKYDVGERLAAWALNRTYGKSDVVVSGPLYKSHKTEGDKVRLSFDHADGLKLGNKKGGIEFVGDPAPTMADVVKKFKVAGSDGVWHDADSVEFSGGDVLVSSASVASPTAVRYAYGAGLSGVFVYNSANLPMVPFRTDYASEWFGAAPDWTPETEVQVAELSPLGYTGTLQTGIVANAGYRLSGDFAATAVGEYTATVTLNEGYQWSDHLKEKSRPVTWSIVEDLTSVGVQLWEGGPEWAMCNIPTNTLEVYGEVFRFDDASNAVSKALGDPWRVPTDTELQELADKCNTQWMTNGNNVVGCLFTSKSNGKSIFLPAAGCLHGNARDDVGKRGCYWSSVVVPGAPDYGFYLSVASDSIHRNWTQRSLAGASVRPVRDAGSGDGPRKAVVPTGKTLTYTGKEQVGVEAKSGSTLSGVVKETEANDEYTAKATLVDGYEWADGLANATREIKWSIAKATPVISGTLAMAGWKEGETASEPDGLSADFGAVTYAYYADPACTRAIARPKTEGTYYVRGEVAASANWNAAVSAAKAFAIAKAGGGDEPGGEDDPQEDDDGAINFTTVDGFGEALKTNGCRVSEAPARGGDYILKLDNGDGTTDYVHAFMTTGEVKTFTTTDDLVARMLLVGGGGGGGGAGNYFVNAYKAIGGGGGGAGAMVERSGYDLAAGTYNIVVGKGGCGAAYFNAGENGGQSSIARDDMEPIVASGGGGGGSWNTSVQNGHDGGCGGGACGTGNRMASCNPGVGDPGKNGGSVTEGQDCSGAGGGGMTTAGKGSTGLESGGGGDGDINNILGCPIYFAGGGAGGVSGTSTQYGSGGLGGGASATSGNGAPGVNGLGGGGSGGSNLGTASGGYGGSGVVIIRYTVGRSVDPEPGRTVTVTRGVGIADIATASGSVFADDAKSATVELAAGAETLELTLVASGDLVIPAYKLVTDGVTNVTARTAAYAVAGGETLTFRATEAGEDEMLGADETLSAIVAAIDDSDGETHAAAVAKVTAIASAGEGGRRMVEPRELAAWIADHRVASAELAASDYVVASVKLDTGKLITEEAEVAFTGIAANADIGIVLEFSLVLEGETKDALALTKDDSRMEFIASCIQATGDLATGFDGMTVASEQVEILEGGMVRIHHEAAGAAWFYRIALPQDPS